MLVSYRNRSIILMAKKVAGCYEMGLCWFQTAWENSSAFDEALTFNQID